jgi:biogenesis of lysosome-related organelles complex 1 subunit 2
MTESTTSFEPLEPHDPSLNHLARNMFEKTADYLQGELTLVQEDYKLLENLNKATAAKYSDMRHIAANVARSLHDLNEKYASLEPLLRQIDQIEDSVNKLEQAAYKLDSYSKRLESKFKMLEKRQ